MPGRLPVDRPAINVAGLALISIVLSACAARPRTDGFPVDLPTTLSDESKAIAVVGDLQMTPAFVRKVMKREFNGPEQAMLMDDLGRRRDGLSALVLVGDLVFSPRSRSDWRRFDAVVGPIASEVPVLPAMGNHDYYCFFVELCSQAVVPRNVLRRFPWLEPGRAYLVSYNNLVLVFVDSETGLEAQGDWLRQRLRESEEEFDAALIFVHRPPYTDSVTRGLEPDLAVQQHIVPALSETVLVPVVISGHAHGYEHLLVDGIHYIVSAGGGGPRGRLRPDRPYDVYSGRDCQSDESAGVLRPLNYLLVTAAPDELTINVHGFCKGDTAIDVVESFRIPLPPRSPVRAASRRK